MIDIVVLEVGVEDTTFHLGRLGRIRRAGAGEQPAIPVGAGVRCAPCPIGVWKIVFVFADVHHDGEEYVALVALAFHALRLFARPLKRGEQDRDQRRDNANDNQQFHERKPVASARRGGVAQVYTSFLT
ncbi:MAG: hypothetical protein JWP03_4285 [Phycisphaerales bacterium]|nr:hypothetical protein [Phycisphaerales bacterium]